MDKQQEVIAPERAPVEELSPRAVSNVETGKPSGKKNEPDCGCNDKSSIDLEKLRVLIVDDSQFSRRIVREGLSLAGIRHLSEAKDAVEAINILRNQPIDIMSGHTEKYRLQEAVAAGISEYVVKPFSPDTLLKHMIRAINCPPVALRKASAA